MRVVEERFSFEKTSIAVVRPGNPADMIDEERFATDEYMPYWAEVWPAGLALARFLAGRDLVGRTVLELGCGIGLPSILAALHGACVTATDWSPEAIAALRENADRNGAILRALVLDWRDAGGLAGAPFDVVLAADVLYEERNVAPVLAAFAACLADTGEAIVADPGRKHAEGFAERAARAGFETTELPHDLRGDRGRLLRLRRQGEASRRITTEASGGSGKSHGRAPDE